MHFAGSIVVPESVENPLKYYRQQHGEEPRADRERGRGRGAALHLLARPPRPTASPSRCRSPRTRRPQPINPYGWSKLMTERMLRRRRRRPSAQLLRAALFQRRRRRSRTGASGQSTAGATHLIKVAVEAATGKRGHVDVFGTDYDTPDGTGVRDYIHVSDLAAAHVARARAADRRARARATCMNCGYGRGFSVLEVLDAVDRVTNLRIERRLAPRRAGDPDALVADNAPDPRDPAVAAAARRPRHDRRRRAGLGAQAGRARLSRKFFQQASASLEWTCRSAAVVAAAIVQSCAGRVVTALQQGRADGLFGRPRFENRGNAHETRFHGSSRGRPDGAQRLRRRRREMSPPTTSAKTTI